VYPVTSEGKKEYPNTSTSMGTRLSRIKTDNYFYRSCFINNSFDVDLTSILFKSRHSMDDVPNQFSADLDFAAYAGFRRDYYKAVGFDNLLDKSKSLWIYNQKPYMGLIISVSSF
jgi:hypothetical protein